MFGSIHQKSFGFLGVNVQPAFLSRRCSRDHEHVKVQGSFTKGTATYVPELAEAIGLTFKQALDTADHEVATYEQADAEGLENQLVNEIAIASAWQVECSWEFKKTAHINLLEEGCVLRLLQNLAKIRKPIRVVNLVDSFVVRGATSKGRSSSLGLSTVLRKVSAFQIAAAIYLTLPFVPTRLNVADDPTRSVELRQPQQGFNAEAWDEADLFEFAQKKGLRKWASNWLRLLLRLCGPVCLSWASRSTWRRSSIAKTNRHWPLDFDSTLGFPGEGPLFARTISGFPRYILPPIILLLAIQLSSLSCIPSHSGSHPFLCVLDLLRLGLFLAPVAAGQGAVGLSFGVQVLLFLDVAEATPMFPTAPGDAARASMRAASPPIPPGRPVTGVTLDRRQALWKIFLDWSAPLGVDFESMLELHQIYIDDINLILERFGRDLYDAGKPYAHFAETLNQVSTLKPAIRRQLQGAWSFGFSWVKHEPSTHHVAMPGPVALAILTTSLMWGWVQFAGMIALMWGGLLRPGEAIASERRDLLLPSDGDGTLPFALLSIKDPKTRYKHARHQSVKIDMADGWHASYLRDGFCATAASSEVMAYVWTGFEVQVSSSLRCAAPSEDAFQWGPSSGACFGSCRFSYLDHGNHREWGIAATAR